jgi:hypothetical protein
MPGGLKHFQQSGQLHFLIFSCYRRRPNFANRIGGAARGLAVEQLPSISQAQTEWSRSNPTGQHGGERDWELFRQFVFVPISETPPKRSLSGAT